MRLLWCWRCKDEMPMLDDDEYGQVMSFRPSTVGNLQTRFEAMLAEYERITGFRETNPNAVFHHRLSNYGPPCLALREAVENTAGEGLRLLHEARVVLVSVIALR